MLKNNETVIGLVCDLLPVFRSECSDLLKELIKGLTADKVCAEVKLCPSAEVAESVFKDFMCTEIGKVSDEDNCQICKDVSTYFPSISLLGSDIFPTDRWLCLQ